MEDKILQMIAWGLTYGKITLITIGVILGTQFIVYQGSRHKINPLKWIYERILGLIVKVANFEF